MQTAFESLPFGLVDVRTAAKMFLVSEMELTDWSVSGTAPCYSLNGVFPLFRPKSLGKWIRQNKLTFQAGMPLPTAAPCLVPVDAFKDQDVPIELSAIQGLMRLPTAHVSGIYFLCLDEKVMYVGKSEIVSGRVADHVRRARNGVPKPRKNPWNKLRRGCGLGEFKEFDHHRVFWLPCPENGMSELEDHYIKMLNPPYNKTTKEKVVKRMMEYRNRKQLLLNYGGAALCPF